MEATTNPALDGGSTGDVWTAPPEPDRREAAAVVPVDPGAVVPLDGASPPAIGAGLGWDALDDTPLPPRRPKLVTPLTWSLFGLLLAVGGFALGAKVGRDHAPTATAGAAGAFGAAARANATGATTTVAGRTQAGAAPAGGAPVAGAPAAGGQPAAGATPGASAPANAAAAGNGGGLGGAAAFGQVKLIDGTNVYIQDNQGNAIKVTTAAGVVVNVAKVGTVADLKPGDTIIVQGTTDADGNVAATSITAGGAGGGFGGRGNRGGGTGGQGGQGGGTQNGQNG